MERKGMDAAVFWLVIIGPILIGLAVAIWYGSSKTFGLWTGFAGAVLLLLAGSLQWQQAILQSQASEQPTQRGGDIAPASTQPVRAPTLEATNKSKIDATGAQIPGDLPFQFGRADNNSLIDMPGINVTRTDDGFTVTSGNVNRQFPAPTGEFASMLVPELRRRIQITVSDLRQFQEDFNRNFFEPNRKWPSEAKAKTVLARYGALYDQKFSRITFSLASAALSKIGTIDGSEMSREARDGGNIVYHGKFVGPDPAERAAAFLELIENKLPQND
jgi:hypothetical protein